MGREILCRGFHECEDGDATIFVDGREVRGRWIEGYYTINGDGNYCIDEVNSLNLWEKSYMVIPSTVGQYTGLTDKNGRKIFEGDICRDNKGDLAQILWSQKHQWGVKILKSDYVLTRTLTFPLWQYDQCKENAYRTLKVVGTIFDTSEVTQ